MTQRIVILGLSITSSWGNGHATTFRGLVRALDAMGHDVLFLERDVPWYSAHRDLPEPPWCWTHLYRSVEELADRFGEDIARADAVIVGSCVPDGIAVARLVLERARGVRAFYDIDTLVTLSDLADGSCKYLSPDLVPRFDLYLSFTGGPTLERLEEELGARRARPLYCSVDTSLYQPVDGWPLWVLGYLGTYSPDRPPGLEALMLAAARRLPQERFVVAGAMDPDVEKWPENIEHKQHLPPDEHALFYGRQRFTLNLTRSDTRLAGWSPSLRLFQAGACGVPLLSDVWEGIDSFFQPGKEILLVRSSNDVLDVLRGMPEREAERIGERARRRVLAEHTPERRAEQLVGYLDEARRRPAEQRLRAEPRQLEAAAGPGRAGV